jgi:cysteinyl-tRNA synthetase
MSAKYMPLPLDIHGGGLDLIFPHHENEIAQSEAATGKVFAAHWFHTTHLLVENRKMSKSDGNLFTLQDLKDKGFTPMEVRYVLLAGKYSQPLNFTIDSLNAARAALKKLAKAASSLAPKEIPFEQLKQQTLTADNPFHAAWEALKNDLNVSEALGQTFVALKDADKFSDKTAAWLGFQRIIQALGLVLPDANDEVTADVPAEVREVAAKRWEAKKAKDWKLADECRAKLSELGWAMQDAKDDYKLTKLN